MNQGIAAFRSGPLRPWLARCAAVLGVLFLTVLMFSPADKVMDVQLDSSNYGSYSYFTAKNFQYGTEVVPMAGPYGFVHYGSTYSGQLFWKRLGMELLTKFSLGILLVWFFVQSSARPVLRWFWLFLVVTMTPFISDIPYSLAILLSGLCLVRYHQAPGRQALAICCAVAFYLALLTLFKGTQTMLAIATFGLLFLQALIARNFRRLPWIAAVYGSALIAFLLIAGQNPLNLPRYLHGVLELSSGYNSAMGLEEPMPVFLIGLCALLCLEFLILVCLVPRWRDPVALSGGLFLAGFTLIFWKHGFVRSDGHVLICFQYACIAAPIILLFFDHGPHVASPRWPRVLASVLASLAIGLGIWADGKPWARNVWVMHIFSTRLAASLEQISAPVHSKTQLDARLAAQRDYYQIPRLRQIAGNDAIDFFGNEEGYLMLNRFNYRPRPMGGGTFNVFTPWLHDINVAFMLDEARRPEYFLVDLQTIDHRFTAQDDAGTLRALLANYIPVETGSGLSLFKTKAGPPRLPEPKLLNTQPLVWNASVVVPPVGLDEMLLVSFTLPLNLAGRVRAALYKPPLVFMDLEGTGINLPADRKIIPGMFHYPVPLNPVLEDTNDVLNLYQREPGKIATRFKLKTAGARFFDTSGMTVSFYSTPRPNPVQLPPIRLVNLLVSKVDPFLVEALAAPILRENGFVAQILVPPARMGFELKGDENQVVFSYGMASATYTLPTDGVDIIVDLERAGQPPQKIFHKNISPRFRPADRGKHTVHLPLPPFPPGSKLYLRVGRGPDDDGAWDLAYFTDIDFVHGPYVPAQFPGFATLPESISAGTCGSLFVNQREVFMLNSPGSVTFRLTGREQKLVFTGGMLPDAYTNGGSSDGVEFQVEMQFIEGSVQRLLNYHFNPLENAADRVDRTFEVPLPQATPGAALILRITPGPSGSEAWDWSYLASVRLQ